MALDTIADLLDAIEDLPSVDREEARARVAEAVERPALAARAALGLLALDLAPLVGGHATDTGDEVIVLPELVLERATA